MMKAVAAFLLVMCYVAVGHAWRCVEGPRLNNAQQIDAGQGMVVARDRYHRVFFLTRRSWYSLGTVALKHVTVGPAGVWGVDRSNKVYKYVAGNFIQSRGLTMLQVDAGGAGQLVGVSTSSYNSYCLRNSYALASRGSGSLNWRYMSVRMKYISCGTQYGCWGVFSNSRPYFTQTISPTSCTTRSWSLVSGLNNLKMIEVGTDGTVMALTTSGHVYQRVGISSRRPAGTGWSRVSMCMAVRHLSYDLGKLWVVTTSGLLMQCSH